LERAVRRVAFPRSITVDHGTEFTSRAIEAWALYCDVEFAFTRRGKPIDTGYIVSFTGHLRDECLNVHSLPSHAHAKARIEERRQDSNPRRPHRSLGGLTPSEFGAHHQDAAHR
jgi:putative transposase